MNFRSQWAQPIEVAKTFPRFLLGLQMSLDSTHGASIVLKGVDSEGNMHFLKYRR
jgi:hypothetical protein